MNTLMSAISAGLCSSGGSAVVIPLEHTLRDYTPRPQRSLKIQLMHCGFRHYWFLDVRHDYIYIVKKHKSDFYHTDEGLRDEFGPFNFPSK